MIWCRFEIDGETSYGIVEGDHVVQVSGSPLGEHYNTHNRHPLRNVKLLAPIKPGMLYAAGPNYRGHVEGMAARRGLPPNYPDRPSPNYRSVHAIIGSGENIVVPKESAGAVQPEGQLAVVIGRKAKNVSVDKALDYVFGYTIGNDISERPWQQADRTMFRSKNCDTWKPMGPWIVTDLPPEGFRIIVRHNGVTWQDFSSSDQIWDTATWIHEISKYATLHPGDVLWMGTQGADGDMVPGDTVEVEISDIGVLKNYVVAEQ